MLPLRVDIRKPRWAMQRIICDSFVMFGRSPMQPHDGWTDWFRQSALKMENVTHPEALTLKRSSNAARYRRSSNRHEQGHEAARQQQPEWY